MKKKILFVGAVVLSILGIISWRAGGIFAQAPGQHQEGDSHDHGKEERGHHEGGADKHQENGFDDHAKEAGEHEESVIELDKEAQDMIQMKTAPAEMRLMENRLKVFGKIAQDTESSAYVTAGGEGVVAEMKTVLGALVDKGEPLLIIRGNDGSNQEILSNAHGVVLAIYVKSGDKVDRLKSLMSIVDIDKLRATVDVYEKDIGFIQVGQKVEVESIAFPGKKFKGEVVYISPHVDEMSQSIKVRVDIDNPDHLLRLGMFVSGEIIHGTDQKALTIPLAAIQELKGKDVVFVVEGQNKFSVREIALGSKFGDYAEIQKGLQDGEQIVTQGSFNLKSEQAKESFGDGHAH